jgi:hypothetical protein
MQVTNRFKTFYILSLLLFTLVSCQTTSPGGKSKRLFTEQGEDWEISETANWTFQDDELTGVSDAIGGYMATKAPYQNFKFKAEFYPIEGVNSGIFFRCQQKDLSAKNCYEANIWDDHIEQQWRTGSIVGRKSPLNQITTKNQWNEYVLQVEGAHIQTWINGQKMIDFEDDELTSGYLLLQVKSGSIKFSNLIISPL